MRMGAEQGRKDKVGVFGVAQHKTEEPLRECVSDALDSYFRQMDGHNITDLYQMVISEVEQPMLEAVMEHAEGNQTRAAAILGMSRSTLRKKLVMYNLD